MTDKFRGPRARTGPGRGRGGSGRTRPVASPSVSAATPASAATTATATGAARGSRGERPRSRLTSRAAVLVLVLAVLMVSYASSLKAFLQQRAHIQDLQTQIAERQRSIDALEAEKRRWSDDAYVEQQARARLGYVMPGEKTYLVLDEQGNALRPQGDLDDPSEVLGDEPTPWWSDAWESVELAGDPPPPADPPAAEIDGSDQGEG